MDLLDLPVRARKVLALTLDQAQRGGKHIDAKPLKGFERLFRFLNALDQDVEIVIKQKARSSKHAEVRVLAA